MSVIMRDIVSVSRNVWKINSKKNQAKNRIVKYIVVVLLYLGLR